MARWKKQPPYQGEIHQGCLSCPPVEQVAQMDMLIAVGFGSAYAMCGSKMVYMESQSEELKSLADIEEMAKKNPNHDWRVSMFGPLRGREYQRQGEDHWVLIDSSQGFA